MKVKAKKKNKSKEVQLPKKLLEWITNVDGGFHHVQHVLCDIDRRLNNLENKFKDKPKRKKPTLKKRKAK